ncbi:MAG: pantoate--beta-alanine ligase [Bdellovibrionia bacterium]
MIICDTPQSFQKWRQQNRDVTLGFVPTMGALHAGHGELLKRAVAENDLAALSIFVNPTQFNDPKDLEKYPRTIEEDIALTQKLGVHCLFLPTPENMYPQGYHYKVIEDDFSRSLCGAHRSGHFDGVLTVVLKLLNLANADRAYFGEKDYQQLELIRGMVRDFFIQTEIIGLPTVREEDGLALSSRNRRLSPEERALAPLIFKTIRESSSALEAQKTLTAAGFTVDYVVDKGGRRYVAAFLGNVRLIDNVQI